MSLFLLIVINKIFIDSYKPILLADEGSRALVSIIALLPQYDSDQDDDDGLTDQINLNNAPAVSHACCALANFATNSKCPKA